VVVGVGMSACLSQSQSARSRKLSHLCVNDGDLRAITLKLRQAVEVISNNSMIPLYFP